MKGIIKANFLKITKSSSLADWCWSGWVFLVWGVELREFSLFYSSIYNTILNNRKKSLSIIRGVFTIARARGLLHKIWRNFMCSLHLISSLLYFFLFFVTLKKKPKCEHVLFLELIEVRSSQLYFIKSVQFFNMPQVKSCFLVSISLFIS